MKLGALALALPLVAPVEHPRVEVDVVDGVPFCTLNLVRSRLVTTLELLAERADLEITGLDQIDPELRTDAFLRNRRIEEALTYLLGGHDLRAEVRSKSVALFPLVSDRPSTDELRELAGFSYLRVTRKFPDHPRLPEVMLQQARVASQIGRVSTARRYYEDLVDRFPNDAQSAPALMELGELLMLQREFGPAAQQFAELLRFKVEPSVEVRAKMRFAEAISEQGQHERALLMLQALDTVRPPATPEARQDRMYLRASFLIGLERHDEALDLLERADQFGLGNDETRRRALRLRAEALEGSDQLAEAARAWIGWQAEVRGEDRGYGLERAALAALEAGRGEDLLAVLFTGRIAAEAGFEERLQPLVDEARTRLGLRPASTESVPAADLLERAIHATVAGHASEAIGLFDAIAERRGELTADQQLEFVMARARALEAGASLQAAMQLLRAELERLTGPEQRRRLYLVAADLYAHNALWEEEAEALQGRL